MIERLALGFVALSLCALSLIVVAFPGLLGGDQPTFPAAQDDERLAVAGSDTASQIGDITPSQATPPSDPMADSGIIIAPAQLTTQSETGLALMVSASPNRHHAVPLDGAGVGGRIFVFAVSANAEQAEFWLDDPSRSGPARQTEKDAPFDFAGSSADLANSFNAGSLEVGQHSITVASTRADGSIELSTASFEVMLSASSTDPSTTVSDSPIPLLLVSTDPRRSSPTALSGSSVRGDIYVYLDLPRRSASSVSFWVNDTSGRPFNVDRNHPYDLAGGSVGFAKPLDTSLLGEGQHSVMARANLSDGSTLLTSARFNVGDSGSMISPSTTSTTLAPSTTATTSAPKAPTATAAPTTTAATSAPTTQAPSIGGDVRFGPGDSVASVVSGSPNGTVFVFSPGVYTGVSIQPKSGQRFLGEPGAVLDGSGSAFAFRSGASDVVISGLEITDYRPASRDGVIQGGTGWLVQSNHIHHNGEIGVHDLVGGRVIGNNIHHNGRYGIAGGGFVLVEGNEIAYNANEIGLTGDSGGTKFVLTTNLVIRRNYVHHNSSHGIWADIDNVNVVTENNRVVANRGNGIFYEIGCGPGGIIRNNHVEGNGFPERYASWMGDTAGVVVALTSGVEVYGNTLVNNTKGIGGIQWDHPGVDLVKRCTPQLSNLNVHGNVITQSGGAAAGIDANTHRDKVWSSWGNRFHSNTYHLSNGARFRWQGNWLTQEQWKALGMN